MPPVMADGETWRSMLSMPIVPAGRHRARQLPDQRIAATNTNSTSISARGLTAGDDRDALRGRGNQPARFLVERRHQFALGSLIMSAVDDVVGHGSPGGAGAGQLRF